MKFSHFKLHFELHYYEKSELGYIISQPKLNSDFDDCFNEVETLGADFDDCFKGLGLRDLSLMIVSRIWVFFCFDA